MTDGCRLRGGAAGSRTRGRAAAFAYNGAPSQISQQE
jgi:hypothetical protein